jgi:hypothetical protein
MGYAASYHGRVTIVLGAQWQTAPPFLRNPLHWWFAALAYIVYVIELTLFTDRVVLGGPP